MNKIIETVNLHKSFFPGGREVPVLRGINLEIKEGEFLIIHGPSGCGKSTLLHSLLGLERPTRGRVFFLKKDFYSLNEDKRAEIRKRNFGMIYQQPYWIRSLPILGNIAFPLTLLGVSRNKAVRKAKEALEKVGMQDWADFFPTELSSGQQQKVALARAIIHNPKVLIADEPTGNLDSISGKELMKLLVNFNKQGKTIIMVTHEKDYLKYAFRVVEMKDGEII